VEGHFETGSLVDLEESAADDIQPRPDTLHDRTVVIVRDNETIECPTTDGEPRTKVKSFTTLMKAPIGPTTGPMNRP
jgi:hypothetical protein